MKQERMCDFEIQTLITQVSTPLENTRWYPVRLTTRDSFEAWGRIDCGQGPIISTSVIYPASGEYKCISCPHLELHEPLSTMSRSNVWTNFW